MVTSYRLYSFLIGVTAVGCDHVDDRACPASFNQVDACGGDLDGDWAYVEACTDYDFTNDLNEVCPEVCPGISASKVARVGAPAGALSVAQGRLKLDVSVTVRFDLEVSPYCGLACPAAASAIEAQYPRSSVDCSSDSGACTCIIAISAGRGKNGDLTTSDGLATLETGEQYNFCVNGDTLRYRGVRDKADGDDRITYVLRR